MRKTYITIAHVAIEIISFLVLIAALVVVIIWASGVEGEVATHFNYAGEPDGYGSAYSELILPIIILVTNILMSLLLHFAPASCWNMPFKVNSERAVGVYRDISFMIVLLELEFAVFTLVMSIFTVNGRTNFAGRLCFWLMGAITVTVIVIPIIAKKHNTI